MRQQRFLDPVRQLWDQGKIICSIAAELGVHKRREHRALTSLKLDVPYKLPESSHAISPPGFKEPALFGRQSEMNKLTAALGERLAGTGRLVMLDSEPGIGTTRRAQELAAVARVLRANTRIGTVEPKSLG